MNWHSPAEFFSMGGYALYVWSSFGVCLMLLAMELMLVRRRQQAILQSLRHQAQAEKLDEENS
jgi:heme exporter protein D